MKSWQRNDPVTRLTLQFSALMIGAFILAGLLGVASYWVEAALGVGEPWLAGIGSVIVAALGAGALFFGLHRITHGTAGAGRQTQR
jgi:apolipoprotein N-acyltransferase